MHFDALCRRLLLECIFKSQLESLSRFCWSLRVSRSYQSSFGSDLRKEVPLRPYYFSPPFALQLDFNHKCVYLKAKNKKDRLIGKLKEEKEEATTTKKVLSTRRKESKVTFELQLLSQCLKGSCGRSSFPWPLSWCHNEWSNEAQQHLHFFEFRGILFLIHQNSPHLTADMRLFQSLRFGKYKSSSIYGLFLFCPILDQSLVW